MLDQCPAMLPDKHSPGLTVSLLPTRSFTGTPQEAAGEE